MAEILFELLFEIFAELTGELLGEAGWIAIGDRRTSRAVAYAACAVLGATGGLLLTVVAPAPLFARRITGASVLFAPLVTAAIMVRVGRSFPNASAPLASFSGAWLFAAAFSGTRLLLLTH